MNADLRDLGEAIGEGLFVLVAKAPVALAVRASYKPLKLSGMGKLTIPVVVWDALLVDEALTNEWDVSIEDGGRSSPEFTMNKR